MSVANPGPEKTANDPETAANGKAPHESTPPGAHPPLRPELQRAVEESWKRNEAAYRYLGR
jgi:hypothetical protein